MTGNNIIHFEILWEQAEKVALAQYKDKSNLELIEELKERLEMLQEIENSTASQELKVSWKNRRIGEFLFIVSVLSARDNINVYASLKEEMLLNEIALTDQTPLTVMNTATDGPAAR